MKYFWTKITGLLLCLLLASTATQAQNANNPDSKYLKGAVPQENGRVVFEKQYNIPGMSQDEIFQRMLTWMEARLKENKNNSRILYQNKEKGQIVGTGDDWITFSSNALSLDRTRILYQLTALCQPEQCDLRIERISYIYREGEEKYTAEEWITDKYALNKSQTKLVRGLAKWRRKTVDFMDNYFQQAAEALSAVGPAKEEQPAEVETVKNVPVRSQEPVVIVPKKQVTTTDKQTATAPETPAATPQQYREVAPDALPANAIQTAQGRLVIVIGSDPFNQTLMTANAGGSLGQVEGKPVIFTILSPDQAHQQLDNVEEYSVRYYPNGSTDPTLILQCRKLPSPETPEGMPRTYIGEIVKVLSK